MRFSIQLARETDGRWIAEVPELPGTLVYGTTTDDAERQGLHLRYRVIRGRPVNQGTGKTTDDAVAKVKALALRVVADQLDHGEAAPDLDGVSFAAA